MSCGIQASFFALLSLLLMSFIIFKRCVTKLESWTQPCWLMLTRCSRHKANCAKYFVILNRTSHSKKEMTTWSQCFKSKSMFVNQYIATFTSLFFTIWTLDPEALLPCCSIRKLSWRCARKLTSPSWSSWPETPMRWTCSLVPLSHPV